jgi:hypothetical protein
MVFNNDIKASAMRLGEIFQDKPWYSSVGISEESGSPVFIVYLLRTPGRGELGSIPKEWEGRLVRTERIGKLKPAAWCPTGYIRRNRFYALRVKIKSSATPNDPATWNAASYLDDPIDHLEPLETADYSEYREAARKFIAAMNAVDQFMCTNHRGKPPRKWYPVALALGLRSVQGRTETAVALELGVTRACISRDVVAILRLARLENDPAWGLKGLEHRRTLMQTNGHHWRKDRVADTNSSSPATTDA